MNKCVIIASSVGVVMGLATRIDKVNLLNLMEISTF